MNFSRLDFIKKASSIVAGLSVGAKIFSEEAPKTDVTTEPKKTIKKSSRAIVIGGGISGLYAAFQLLNSGYKVTLIEATNRLGGRIFTHKDSLSELTGELGAEFILDKQKEIQTLCKKLNIALIPIHLQPELLINGALLPGDKLSYKPKTLEIVKRIFELHKLMPSEKRKGLDEISIYNYLRYQGVDNEELHFLNLSYSSILGEELRVLSANKGIPSVYNFIFNHSKYFRVKGGVSSIVSELETQLKKANIILKDPVKSITQNEKSVAVTTESGQIIEGSICICTLPPPLLESISWNPELPKEKKLAALKMNYSRMTKVLSFWENCLWLKDDLVALSNSFIRMLYISGEDIQKKRGLLTSIIIGNHSEIFYQYNEDYTKKLIEFTMQSYDIFKQNQLASLVYKSWQHEPFFCGAHSVFYPGTFGISSILKEPLDRVFFAGEHLAKETGSMNSGLQSVNSTLELI